MIERVFLLKKRTSVELQIEAVESELLKSDERETGASEQNHRKSNSLVLSRILIHHFMIPKPSVNPR